MGSRTCMYLVVVLASTAVMAQTAEPTKSLPEAGLVQEHVKAIIHALHEGDGETLVKFSYPRVVEAMGGVDDARVALAIDANQMRTQGIKLDSIRFPDPPKFVDGKDGRRFAIVRVSIVTSKDSQRAESHTFEFAVKDSPTSRWSYIDGERITPATLKELFPDFPSNYEFPKISREVH